MWFSCGPCVVGTSVALNVFFSGDCPIYVIWPLLYRSDSAHLLNLLCYSVSLCCLDVAIFVLFYCFLSSSLVVLNSSLLRWGMITWHFHMYILLLFLSDFSFHYPLWLTGNKWTNWSIQPLELSASHYLISNSRIVLVSRVLRLTLRWAVISDWPWVQSPLMTPLCVFPRLYRLRT